MGLAINVRNKIIRNNFNPKLYYQLSALSEQCQKRTWTDEEVRVNIPILKKEKDLSDTNLIKIRDELRFAFIDIIKWNERNYTDYILGKIIYAISCISYPDEGFEGLNAELSKTEFIVEYVKLVIKASETMEQVEMAIENLTLL